ncbi:MAG TPA: radical SAM/SPASM domain-containing protein, partial [Caulobacteraceae bacterium]
AHSVQLHGIGEPLTSPSFWRALEGNHFHKDCEVSFNSNLTILDDKRINRLLQFNGKLLINISLDAATEQTYRRIRGYDFNIVLNNLRRLVSARGDRPLPIVFMNMTLMRENIEEVVQFVELAKDLGANGVLFGHLNRLPGEYMARYKITQEDGWRFDYAQQGLWNFPDLSNKWIRAAVQRGDELQIPVNLDHNKVVFFDEEEDGLDATPHGTSESTSDTDGQISVKDCNYPWNWAIVASDGRVAPCCFSTNVVGNINEDKFETIWNGDRMQELRRDVLADRINTICKGASCKYVQAMNATTAPEVELETREPSITERLRKVFIAFWRRTSR